MIEYEGSRGEFLKLLAEMGEEPAFITRARATDKILERTLKRCQRERDELLVWPRRHFDTMRKRVADNWSRLARMIDQQDPDSVWV